MTKTATLIQLVAGDLQGDEYTAAVRKVYDTILSVGPDASPEFEAVAAAGDDLTQMPNAALTAAGVYAVRATFNS